MNKRRRRALLLLGLAALVLAATVAGLPVLGRWLVVADPLQASDAIIVLDGATPVRELEAAALYHRRLAPRIVVPRARDPYAGVRVLAGEPSPQERSVRVLLHVGVPRLAIETLEREVENTAQELDADAAHGLARGYRRVILVTSPAHTRRVRIIWNRRHQAALAALVHPTPHARFDPGRWWQSRRGVEEALHEVAGIVHFLVGSPLPTYGR
jgi:uncharacterized SAM-binding protein YcdF (DUF218 family)